MAVESWLWNHGCGILALEMLAVDSWLWTSGCGLPAVVSWAAASQPKNFPKNIPAAAKGKYAPLVFAFDALEANPVGEYFGGPESIHQSAPKPQSHRDPLAEIPWLRSLG